MYLLLTKWRELKGYSQKSLAQKMNISQSYISKIESRKKVPTIFMLNKFAKALDIPICELLCEDLRGNCPYKNKL